MYICKMLAARDGMLIVNDELPFARIMCIGNKPYQIRTGTFLFLLAVHRC